MRLLQTTVVITNRQTQYDAYDGEIEDSWCKNYLWSPYGIGRPYIFSCCGLFFFFFLFFIPRLISAAADWMSAIPPHMVWP